MNKSIRRFPLVVTLILMLVLVSVTQASPADMMDVQSARNPDILSMVSGLPDAADNTCVEYSIFNPNETVIDVPGFCINGLCKILLYQDTNMGAFGPGMLWPVFYIQYSIDNSWIGGPNINLTGVDYSDGMGFNGDNQQEAIFYGKLSGEGNYIAIYDDGASESSAKKWTVEISPDADLTSVSLNICSVQHYYYSFTDGGIYNLIMPVECFDMMCGIMAWSDGAMGGFGPGMVLPVHYLQDGAEGSWVGGPNISFANFQFSAGSGVNGDSVYSPIIGGTSAVPDSGYVYITDDGIYEQSNTKWTLDFNPKDDLTETKIIVYPLECEKHDVIKTGQSAMVVPDYCLDEGICQVLVWQKLSEYMGAFGTGFLWPVYYTQYKGSGNWGGGPNLAIAGIRHSDGRGINGDVLPEAVLFGGLTDSGGYVRLDDDSSLENFKSMWTVDFNPDDNLTEAAYYTCAWTCDFQRLSVSRPFAHLPLIFKE